MDSTIITCKACGNGFNGKFCNRCGEKVYKDSDKSVLHLVEEGFHFVTHFEGTFFTTIRYIFTRPGKLSELYCGGIRKTLFKPLSLFFLLIIIYLLFPAFEGLNMRLYFHTHNSFYGNYAFQKTLSVAQEHHWTDAQLTEAFRLKSEKVSKFLLLVLLPLTAFFFWAFTYKKRRYFFDQMVFATEVNSFYLIWGFMLLPLLLTLVEIIYKAITGTYFPIGDGILGPIIYVLLLIYVVLGMKRFYKMTTAKAIGITFLFYWAHFLIVQVVYKFLLFTITMFLLG